MQYPPEVIAAVERDLRADLRAHATDMLRTLMMLSELETTDVDTVDAAIDALTALGCDAGVCGLYGIDNFDAVTASKCLHARLLNEARCQAEEAADAAADEARELRALAPQVL